MSLVFYNTLSRKKEKFEPIFPKKALAYTCGPTVYNYVHIGNLRTFMFEDLLMRYLSYAGYEVTQVMNLTDVDDKTIKGSQREKIPLNDYTKKYKEAFFEDIKTLNILPATHYPAATEHIDEMVELIKTLMDKELAYKADDGSIYFSIAKFPNYGKLAGIDKDQLKTGASGRVGADEYSKEEARDFVLWKNWSEDDGDVFWETELGKGRPGWHLECSAMSIKYLGESFDIHCGGVDNMFPHHENEIAQSEGASGKQFVKYWMHSAFLNINAEKMAKSKGNFFTLRDLVDKGHSPMAIRYALISTHYRQPLNFSEELIKQSEAALKRVKEFKNMLSKIDRQGQLFEYQGVVEQAREAFVKAMDDDLNISPALGVFFDFIRKTNSLSDKLGSKDAKKALSFLDEVNQVIGTFDFQEESEDNLEEEILQLLKERAEARAAKNYQRSDEIRDYLLSKNIRIKDTKEGAEWEKI